MMPVRAADGGGSMARLIAQHSAAIVQKYNTREAAPSKGTLFDNTYSIEYSLQMQAFPLYLSSTFETYIKSLHFNL